MFVYKMLLLPLCSPFSLFSQGCERQPGTAAALFALLSHRVPSMFLEAAPKVGEQRRPGAAGAGPAAGWFGGPARLLWREMRTETLGPRSLSLDMLHMANITKKSIIRCWVYKGRWHKGLVRRSHLGALWHTRTCQPSANNHASCKALRKGGSQITSLQ